MLYNLYVNILTMHGTSILAYVFSGNSGLKVCKKNSCNKNSEQTL